MPGIIAVLQNLIAIFIWEADRRGRGDS